MLSNSRKSILEYFPYPQIRTVQMEVLEQLEREWQNFDVFVLVAPTATGKTAISKTIMNWTNSCSVITPTNLLVNQYLEEFPDTPTLHRLDSYYCEEWMRPCTTTRGKLGQFCRGGVCPCSADLSTAKYRRGPGIYNYHTYLAHGLHRDVLVVDEAHNLVPTIQARLTTLIWQHDYKYPRWAYNADQLLTWIGTLPANKQKHKKIRLLKEALESPAPQFVVQRGIEEFNGKGTIRGEPEERDCLKLYPVDISNQAHMFWPEPVNKLILMSATIGKTDIEDLGLNRQGRRVLYLHCASPIPGGNRPIIAENLVSVNRNNENSYISIIANRIEELATWHSEEKGVVHATYQLSAQLQRYLVGDRYLFHTRENKKEVYEQFRNSRNKSILVACGMYEGIDLPDDLGRWQVVAKVPWKSLGDPAIAYRAKENGEWYAWSALKDLMQACGRICRHEEDFGITYILDSSFRRLYLEYKHLMPQWWLESLKIVD